MIRISRMLPLVIYSATIAMFYHVLSLTETDFLTAQPQLRISCQCHDLKFRGNIRRRALVGGVQSCTTPDYDALSVAQYFSLTLLCRVGARWLGGGAVDGLALA